MQSSAELDQGISHGQKITEGAVNKALAARPGA
jgi:hypothetical protein